MLLVYMRILHDVVMLLSLPQIAYGDHDPGVHRPGFLKEQLAEMLPAHMSSSKRRVEFERRVLLKHSEMSQLTTEDTQVHCNPLATAGENVCAIIIIKLNNV